MAGLAKLVDVHSHPILPFGQGAPVGEGHKQPDWSVESALSYMDEHDISACVLSDPDSANHATGQRHAIPPGASTKHWRTSFPDTPAGLGRSQRCPVRMQTVPWPKSHMRSTH
jgi:hypothetical protein